MKRIFSLEEKLTGFIALNRSGIDSLILCLVGVLHLLEIQREQKTFIKFSSLTSWQKNNCLKFLVNRIK